MFFLFRLIRKDLIQVNNVKKYILYAIGEIILIVVGILIALQIGNWNDRRLDRVEEREVLTRISEEVNRHVEIISEIQKAFPDVNRGLDQVNRVFDGELISDKIDFLNAVVISGSFGYSTPRMPTAAYEELVSSGKLQLIQRVELRDLVSTYFLRNSDTLRRSDVVIGEYGSLTLDLIPREPGASINISAGEMSDEVVEKVVASVLKSNLGQHIIRQRNRLGFLEFLYTRQVELANELLAEIEKELETK